MIRIDFIIKRKEKQEDASWIKELRGAFFLDVRIYRAETWQCSFDKKYLKEHTTLAKSSK